MRVAYLDCFSGISGDMFLGALLDAGVPARVFEDAVAALNIGARLEIKRVTRQGIAAAKVDVFVGDERELPREVYWEQQGHSDEHSLHQHDHGAGHSHGASDVRASRPHPHKPDHPHERDLGRGLREIREIIRRAAISEAAKKTAIAIFENLGAAEAKIHNTSIENIHFHEVGAVDAMVDIVCAAVGAETLSVDEWVCSPLNVGSGTVKCAHGTLPVPAPATLELLKDAPVYSSGPQVELVTPTGAAIVKTLAARFGSMPQMRVQTSAYGAGTRDFRDQANVLRLTLGETRAADEKHAQQTVMVLEANLDDLSPQVFGYVMDRLLEEGALDAFGTPVQMKKGRPGMLLTVLARPEDAARMEKIILAETTTLGVRRREEQRRVLERRFETVKTQWGDVRMKVANLNGTVSHYAPEYEDCRRIAAERHVPLKRVMQEAVMVYLGKSE
jgi:pyridinium-3,5-bisthiocarboxylic acid mononucleotide nickel chelatase